MSFEAVNWAWDQKGLNPTHKLVLLALANRHNPDLGCFPSLTKIRALQSADLVRVERSLRPNGSQTSNRYSMAFEWLEKKRAPRVQNDHPPIVKMTTPPYSKRPPHKQVISKQVSLIYNGHFDLAWSAYPRKQGKGNARSSWVKACEKIQENDLLLKLEAYSKSVEQKDKKFIPHMATWLNQERWDDELGVGEQQTSSEYLESLFRGGVLGIENK